MDAHHHVVQFDDVMRDPSGVRSHLLAHIWGLSACRVLWADAMTVAYGLELEPWVKLQEVGYPTERLGLLVSAMGNVFATPRGPDGREWRHRYSPQGSLFGELCLWDPADPDALRWTWGDGLVSFVTIVHRHLQAEEFARRHGMWPSEDSPHGPGPHPLRTDQMRRAVSGWQR